MSLTLRAPEQPDDVRRLLQEAHEGQGLQVIGCRFPFLQGIDGRLELAIPFVAAGSPGAVVALLDARLVDVLQALFALVQRRGRASPIVGVVDQPLGFVEVLEGAFHRMALLQQFGEDVVEVLSPGVQRHPTRVVVGIPLPERLRDPLEDRTARAFEGDLDHRLTVRPSAVS